MPTLTLCCIYILLGVIFTLVYLASGEKFNTTATGVLVLCLLSPIMVASGMIIAVIVIVTGMAVLFAVLLFGAIIMILSPMYAIIVTSIKAFIEIGED